MIILEPLGSKKECKKGFTLVEMMIVIGITTLILVITENICFKTLTYTQERAYIQCYHRMLKLTQLEAMSHVYRVSFAYQNPRHYQVKAFPFQSVKLSVPSLFIHYPQTTIVYNPNGSTQARTLVFESKNYRYLFVFQIGRGEFRYEEKRLDSH